MSENHHRLALSSSNSSQRRNSRNSTSSGGGSSSSGSSTGGAANKRYTSSGSGTGKNKSRRTAATFDADGDENADPRDAVWDLVEATKKQAIHSSIPEAADAMLDAMEELEWCPALRSHVMLLMAKEAGLMLASKMDMGKAKAEPESRKTAFKSAAFHLILPFMGYFKGVCLTTIDCEEHSLLKMVGYLWSEWDPEKPISKTELSKEVAIFVAPMKSTTWRAVRAALYSNVLGMLKKVTVQYTENDGSPGQELTSDFIVDTITTQKEKQPEAAMRGLGYAMFSKCLGPAKHGIPVGKGETMKPMTYYEVFKCNPTAPWHQVMEPTVEVALQEMNLYVQRNVLLARRNTLGHKTSNKSDPEKYRTFPVCKEFLEKAFGGKEGGGDKQFNVIKETFWEQFLEFGLEYLGDIPEPGSIRRAEDARRYLKPYLFQGEVGGGESDEGEGGGAQGNGGRGGDKEGNNGAGGGSNGADAWSEGSDDI